MEAFFSIRGSTLTLVEGRSLRGRYKVKKHLMAFVCIKRWISSRQSYYEVCKPLLSQKSCGLMFLKYRQQNEHTGEKLKNITLHFYFLCCWLEETNVITHVLELKARAC